MRDVGCPEAEVFSVRRHANSITDLALSLDRGRSHPIWGAGQRLLSFFTS